MSSGNKREKINTNERAVSDDFNRMQAFIAQERNDIVSALVRRSYSEFEQPGVSVPSSGAAATPLAATVIDGLEIIVDSPGSVMISPGVLAAWNGTPGGADDTGIEVIVDPGIQSTGVLTIATNGGGSPRCDVIECRIVHDAVVEGGISRDIRNPTTGVFTPTNVDKVLKSHLEFQVRQGTPGSGPGYSAGWLPLGLAIVQPGATTSQVDFYDVRPLYRSMGNAISKEAASVVLHPIDPNLGMGYTCTVAAIAAAVISGNADVRWDDQRFGGPLYRNSPVSVPGNFGVTTSAGGDYQNIILNNDNLLRGSGFSAAADDVIVLGSWVPDLGVDGVYLPRCVRYSEGNNPANSPSLPARRRAFGPDGILLAVAYSQDAMGLALAKTLNSAGIGGCLGKGFGVPLARVQLDAAGTSTLSKLMGGAEGIRAFQGFPRVLNRSIDIQPISHSGGISISAETSASPTPITNGTVDIPVLAGDKVKLNIGSFYVVANGSITSSLLIVITEDFGRTSSPATTKNILLLDTVSKYITVPLAYPVTKTGTLHVALFVQSDGTHTITVASPLDDWGTYEIIRPL